MNFRTQIPTGTSTPLSAHAKIDHKSKILLLGSCFTENIGEKFEYFKFQNTINPFGILFHPKAIEKLITDSINQKKYTDTDVFFHNERWHCFDAHSDLSNPSKEDLLEKLNATIVSTHQYLKNTTHIIITLGTAWVYRQIETDCIVANCHKIPQKKFLKELLSVDEITASLENIVALVKSVNPKIQFIFTVSPVRHLKDGFTENSLSKAHLIASILQVLKENSSLSEVEGYFPSFEIMMDDLRDYRFYKSDMIHPNQTAINYIWEHFKSTWINQNSFGIMNQIDTIQKGLSHRPFNKKSEQHQLFLENLQSKIENLKSQHNITF
ncbi:MAG: GSCFA domain-containing protein [Flavobacteriaceae bacterium]|nr:MAG: GSCFA domain-containing protein [Flavobacteriaceae bacterium]